MSDEHHVALCSGGTDSVAATHYAMTNDHAEAVVFLDTGTAPDEAPNAIDATVAWLEEWCADHGWPFHRVETPADFTEWVAEQGYPGPPLHWIAYNKLKDRAIDKYRKQTVGELHCWTGIRTAESEQRAEFDAEDDERGDGRWYWHRPLIDWSDDEVTAYLDDHDLEPASVVQEIGRSADCWCGCFGDRMELIDLEAAGFEAHAEWLESLDTPDGCPREQAEWAGYNWEKHDYAAEDDLQTTLCGACQKMRTDGGGDDGI